MAGEDEASTDINAFCNKKVWQRFLITVAGPVMNILLGVICMFTMVGIDCINDGYLASNVVDSFFEDAVSDDYGLMAGDEIIKIDGVYVHTGQEVVYEILNNGYEPIDILVVRNGEKVRLEGVQFPLEETAGTKIGNRDFYVKAEAITFSSVVKHATFRSISTVKVIVDGIKDLIMGRYGAEAVSGPIGMAGAVEDAINIGFYSLLHLFTLITINLGVFNLLPLPALDGGRIIFLLIEMVRRKPLKQEIEGTINTVGLLVLLGLMLFVTLKDVINLF
jgi:regulator of sigma E protease